MPDCEADGCQWDDEVYCDDCPLRAEKRMALVTDASHPLYRLAAQYTHAHTLGIPQDHPGITLSQAVRIVDGERKKIELAESKKPPPTTKHLSLIHI